MDPILYETVDSTVYTITVKGFNSHIEAITNLKCNPIFYELCSNLNIQDVLTALDKSYNLVTLSVDTNIIAFAIISLRGQYAHIKYICSISGYGRKLMLFLIEHYEKLELKGISLNSILITIPFYLKLGFKFTYDDEPEQIDIIGSSSSYINIRFKTVNDCLDNKNFKELVTLLILNHRPKHSRWTKSNVIDCLSNLSNLSNLYKEINNVTVIWNQLDVAMIDVPTYINKKKFNSIDTLYDILMNKLYKVYEPRMTLLF